MTPEERLQRIEHVTAGLADQAQLDREENRQLWRDTERQIQDTQRQLDQLARHVDEFAVETRLRLQALTEESAARDRASRERDALLDARVDRLVSAIGEFIAAQRPPQS